MNLLHIVSLISLWCPKKADTIRISQAFLVYQKFGYIADTCNPAARAGIDNFTSFFWPLIFSDKLALYAILGYLSIEVI